MVDKRILDYLKKYRGKYPLDALRQKIISSGYTPRQVDKAIQSLGLGKVPGKPVVSKPMAAKPMAAKPMAAKPMAAKPVAAKSVAAKSVAAKSVAAKSVAAKPMAAKPVAVKPGSIQTNTKGRVPWIKIASIFGFIILVLMLYVIVTSMLSTFGVSLGFLENSILLITISSINFLAFLLFYFGFFRLGKPTNSKLLRVSSLMVIFLEIALIIFITLIWFFVAKSVFSDVGLERVSSAGVGGDVNLIWVILAGVIVLASVIVQILFSIALIKIGNQVKFAKISGALNLIAIILGILVFAGLIIVNIISPAFALTIYESSWILTIVSGLLSLLVLLTILFESLCLLNASKKFE